MSTSNEPPKVEAITKWRTRDGRDFYSESAAIYHAEQIDASGKATALLEEGKSVAEALRAVGWSVLDDVLERITKDTELVISHWQCRDQPGYKVVRFNADHTAYVYGDAGSWSGSYGGDVPMKDLVYYASKTPGLKALTASQEATA